MQDTGERFWESEYEVTELGTGNSSVSVFRTNDYRFGFIAENNGQMKWVLSHRNYAGMAVRPESINAQLQGLDISIVPVNNIETEVSSENILTSANILRFTFSIKVQRE